ncbi:hypothetical protein HY490_02445 [Candidatus Woesearchaeota archaeon]|nr:hypothetical protein [Candidatus Woesearchaeota archaeon]
MAVLKCTKCPSKVESNRCCGNPMHVKGKLLACGMCGKAVEVNRCCGQNMVEMK